MKGLQLGVGVVGGFTALGLVACGSVPPPHERQASTELDAQQVPQAALHLKLAQEQFDKGKALIDDGENSRASYVLMRAQADAELALALARENKTRQEAQVLIDRLRAARGPVPTSAMDQSSSGQPSGR
jgi:outer membrane protein TolC